MAWRWLPWRAIVRRAARAYGVMDPLRLLARLRRFSQPSEIAEPMELVRAGIIFHARGLVNTKAIQHNLDWVWPHWVVRQFDPANPSFVPRAFSFSHINLTHRNWTAVGLPDCPHYPIVDPRGLFTPLHDGWSIDCWIVGGEGTSLLPSHCVAATQSQTSHPHLEVATEVAEGPRRLQTRARVVRVAGRAHARLDIEAEGRAPGPAEAADRLAVAVRPYNPEGVQFIDHLGPLAGGDGFRVNRAWSVRLDPAPASLHFHTYAQGDVYHGLHGDGAARREVECRVGMANAAALYAPDPAGRHRVRVEVPLEGSAPEAPAEDWRGVHSGCAELAIPDAHLADLFDAARTNLVLFSVDDIVPGPYTYRRFWFRDACIIVHALLAGGYIERARQALDRFPERQKATGYFHSQEGEWDPNGQVLWAYGQFASLTGETLPERWLHAMERGARWIARKRMRADAGPGIGGLLPAGFSAEHLGPNDYYYWDDWWALAGLQAAARVLHAHGRQRRAARAATEADSLRHAIHASLASIPTTQSGGAMPAAPGRRLDAGAIGSLVADYPLHLLPPGDAWTLNTIDYLQARSFHRGGFFQNMIHSGINPYLTLDIAQSLLRAGQADRAWPLIRTVADLASPTGQWPEAIHPHTAGGCMGDGQHAWAAAEWVMILRALFVREEDQALVLGAGVPEAWLHQGETLSFGPTPTRWGPVTVTITTEGAEPTVQMQGQWRGEPPTIEARLPGRPATAVPDDGQRVALNAVRA